MIKTARLRAWRKRLVRYIKVGLQSPRVFRWAMFALRVIAELRRWWH
ncbi:hypothetical protein [Luteibacter mycovicinus]|nr:hypothetical protein [Luteibacter sp. 9143a]